MPAPAQDSIDVFTRHRPRLIRIAYRMLGSMAEAEDVVQDAYLRWHQMDQEEIRTPEAFLVRMVGRLCLDVLKSARVQRESYIGTWLPEPLIDEPDYHDDSLTLTLMMVLERLSPLERASFLLHDVFGLDFNEVAEVIGREASTCRQLASRARNHVQEAQPRYPVPRERGKEIAAAFRAASREGNLHALQSLLAADVVMYSDGGGKRIAALKPIVGIEKVVRFLAGVARKSGPQSAHLLAECSIDGLPGFVTLEHQDTLQSTALLIEAEKVKAIYIVRNPDKLKHLRPSSPQSILSA